MRPTLSDLSVIVPVGPGDTSWEGLIPDLVSLPLDTEILFVSPEMQKRAPGLISKRLAPGRSVKWIQSEKGRAKQLNRGAQVASKPYLWFLHADSRFARGTLAALERSLLREPEAIHFFDLRFLKDGPDATRLNAWGVWVRSHLLGMPFGDQGFCLAKSVFEKLGRFPESALYGEDHLLIWQAKQMGVPLQCTNAELSTSARKYQEKGWGRTTLKHGLLTWKQALPEIVKWAQVRIQKGWRS